MHTKVLKAGILNYNRQSYWHFHLEESEVGTFPNARCLESVRPMVFGRQADVTARLDGLIPFRRRFPQSQQRNLGLGRSVGRGPSQCPTNNLRPTDDYEPKWGDTSGADPQCSLTPITLCRLAEKRKPPARAAHRRPWLLSCVSWT